MAGYHSESETKLVAEMDRVDSESTAMTIPVDSLIVDDEREETDLSGIEELKRSISKLGLLQRIVVVREGDSFKVVCGRRRTRACKELGWKAIPAFVHELEGVDREMATLSENLHRLELTKAERDEAMRRWVDYYEIKNPGWTPHTGPKIGSGRDVPGGEGGRKEPANPIVAAAKAFGVSKDTVKKAVQRARGLTDSQRKVLDASGVTLVDMNYLADMEPDQIERVVNLVSIGFSFEEALRDVEDSVRKSQDEPISVEDILRTMPARRTIIDTEAIDADVVAWKAVHEHIEEFKKKINWDVLKNTIGKGPHGLAMRRFFLTFEMPHPKTWTTCRCQLSGNRDQRAIMNCPICRGGGYQIGQSR